jgi:hypothetical protein
MVFLFDKIIPGVYRVYSAKPASKTQGEARVTVQAGEMGAATVNLLR